MPGAVLGTADFPVGIHDAQSPGRYRLEQDDDHDLFSWAVGPGSWKAEFFPPTQELWSSTVEPDGVTTTVPQEQSAPLAIIGARPCELAALGILDKVLLEGSYPDPRYASRRHNVFIVVAECGSPAQTCFCTSMGTGPNADNGFDLALTELHDVDGHRFLVRVGSSRGAEVLEQIPRSPAATVDMDGASRASSPRPVQLLAAVSKLVDWRTCWSAILTIPDGTKWPSAACRAATAHWSARHAFVATSPIRRI